MGNEIASELRRASACLVRPNRRYWAGLGHRLRLGSRLCCHRPQWRNCGTPSWSTPLECLSSHPRQPRSRSLRRGPMEAMAAGVEAVPLRTPSATSRRPRVGWREQLDVLWNLLDALWNPPSRAVGLRALASSRTRRVSRQPARARPLRLRAPSCLDGCVSLP